ncbi:hypothetical protein DHEL01_v209960 [Diaporthe helianthi]|uniref:RING-type domain-containing protein n=1 Tax=Diaporthe helianthi TaxID=158607 RepID=A0A2P5HN10_DIAHE|nr:hypothetical protein DHEL01_v209960 [Diaporthe helianthi]
MRGVNTSSRGHEQIRANINQPDDQPSPVENGGQLEGVHTATKDVQSRQKDGAPENHSMKPLPKHCHICIDALEDDDAIQALCGHAWCRGCLNKHVAMATKDARISPGKCCNSSFLPQYYAHVKPEVWAAYLLKKEERQTLDPTFCYERKCSEFIPTRNIGKDKLEARCSCGRVTCAKCKAKAHSGECIADPEKEQFLELARKNSWQPCPRCKAMIERIDGCNSMAAAIPGSAMLVAAKPPGVPVLEMAFLALARKCLRLVCHTYSHGVRTLKALELASFATVGQHTVLHEVSIHI